MLWLLIPTTNNTTNFSYILNCSAEVEPGYTKVIDMIFPYFQGFPTFIALKSVYGLSISKHLNTIDSCMLPAWLGRFLYVSKSSQNLEYSAYIHSYNIF